MLAGFEVEASLDQLYPAIFPERTVPADSPISKGFRVFTKNCFACHTLNHNGMATMGPDLNLPMSPTEYFRETALKKLIRDPGSVRQWKGRRMPGFATSAISDAELNQLMAYLRHMAQHKKL